MMTEPAIDFIDVVYEETYMDKSEVVDRAVKYYAWSIRNGRLNDPKINDEIEELIMEGLEESDELGSAERIRKLLGM